MAITHCLLRGKADAVCVQVFQEGSVNRIWKFTHFYNIVLTIFQRRTKMLTPARRKACQVLASGQEWTAVRSTSPWGSKGERLTRRRKNCSPHDTLQVAYLISFPWPLTSSSMASFQITINSTRLQINTCCGGAASVATLGEQRGLPGRVPTPRPLNSIYGSQVGLFL